MTFRERHGRDEFTVHEHGLLWIVRRRIYGPMMPCDVEDSRWDSEWKASQHCNKLNNKSNQEHDYYIPSEVKPVRINTNEPLTEPSNTLSYILYAVLASAFISLLIIFLS